jgi:diacylglycerol kinase family enzyme
VRISLVHNPTAGGGQDADQLVKLLTDAGHEVRHRSSKADWDTLLQDPGDLIVAAGGDGTVRKVALAAADRGVRFAILPIGTANNIGKTLGMLGDARELIQSWDEGPGSERGLDIGELTTSETGSTRFVEAVGGGPVAELIARGRELEEDARLLGRETDRALHLLGELLREGRPLRWRISSGDMDLSGDYLGVEVLNVRFVGPNVPLAPDADPSDGLLDVVTIRAEDRQPILDYLDRRLHLASGVMPALRTERVDRIRIVAPAGVRLHVDDSPSPGDEVLREPMGLDVRCHASALTLLGVEPPAAD